MVGRKDAGLRSCPTSGKSCAKPGRASASTRDRLRLISAVLRAVRMPRPVRNPLPIECCRAIHTSDGSSVNVLISAVGPHAPRGLQQKQKGDP